MKRATFMRLVATQDMLGIRQAIQAQNERNGFIEGFGLEPDDFNYRHITDYLARAMDLRTGWTPENQRAFIRQIFFNVIPEDLIRHRSLAELYYSDRISPRAQAEFDRIREEYDVGEAVNPIVRPPPPSPVVAPTSPPFRPRRTSSAPGLLERRRGASGRHIPDLNIGTAATDLMPSAPSLQLTPMLAIASAVFLTAWFLVHNGFFQMPGADAKPM